jgi:DNA repair exonuclease SbcCD nuclease subunit
MFVTGDLQIQEGPRFDDTKNALNSMVQFSQINRLQKAVILGDIYERNDVMAGSPSELVFLQFIVQLLRLNMTVYILLGNHDISTDGTSLLASLDKIAPWVAAHDDVAHEKQTLYVISEPRIIDNMAFVPYPQKTTIKASGFLEREYMKSVIDSLNMEENDVGFLFLHCDIAGAEPEKGMSQPSDAIQVQDFNRWCTRGGHTLNYVVAGHYHKHQVLEGANIPVMYVGSPTHVTFASGNDPKGFIHVHEGFSKTLCNFIEIPSRHQIELVYNMEEDNVDEWLSKVSNIRGAHVKVRVIYQKGRCDALSLRKIKDFLRENGAYNVLPTPVQRNVQADGVTVHTESVADIDVLRQYLREVQGLTEIDNLLALAKDKYMINAQVQE